MSEMYKVVIYFTGSAPATFLVTKDHADIIHQAVANDKCAVNIMTHGFIRGNETGVFVDIRGDKVDYATFEPFTPPES